mgnify:CR=1 FL=1
MNKFTAITLFFAGLIVLGSSAMAANGDAFVTKTIAPPEEIKTEPSVTYKVADIDVGVALLEMELGMHPKKPVVKTAPKQKECHFRGLVQAGRLGEVVNVCD